MRLYFVHQAPSVKRSTTICVPFGRSSATSRLPQPFHGIFADCFIYFGGKRKTRCAEQHHLAKTIGEAVASIARVREI